VANTIKRKVTRHVITVIRGGAKTPSDIVTETFDGTVWRDVVMPKTDGVNMANVFFNPGARTHWHTHEGGQILLMVAGEGIVADDDGPVHVRAGDVVWTPPGVRHWHGASPDHFLLHLAISLQGVEWHEPVPEDEYQRCGCGG
jgi:quercetin dioxygenase-like cupin family protein